MELLHNRAYYFALAIIVAGCSEAPKPQPLAPSNYDYIVMATRFTTKKLAAPGTARFAPFDDWHVKEVAPNKQRLIGWVDANNPFGAQIRKSVVVYISYVGDGRFELDDFEFLDWEDSGTWAKLADVVESYEAKKKEAAAKAPAATPPADRENIVYLKDVEPTPPVGRHDLEWKQQVAEAERDLAAAKEREQRRAEAKREAQQMKVDQDAISAQIIKQREAQRKFAESLRYHKWTSANGKYTFEAELTKFANGKLTLVSREGQEKQVQLDDVSNEDQQYVDDWKQEKLANVRVIVVPEREPEPKKKPRKKR